MRSPPGARGERDWNPLFEAQRTQPTRLLAAWDGSRVLLPLQPEHPAPAVLAEMHAEVRALILGEGYPCVGARAVLNQKNYWFGLYPALGSPAAARAVCHDLYEFNHRFPTAAHRFISFLAGFAGPAIQSEYHFEQLLWDQLRAMHEVDRRFFAWDKRVSADPAQHDFSFSIGGRSYFIIGMHGIASRKARAFSRPMLVFNAHEQFEALRARGKFTMMRNIIRFRDLAYQGTINPVLQDHGEGSEARQYSGRAVPEDWVCPFRPLPDSER